MTQLSTAARTMTMTTTMIAAIRLLLLAASDRKMKQMLKKDKRIKGGKVRDTGIYNETAICSFSLKFSKLGS